ncbi:hypothetical protein FSP39_017737 [Pinctada imbricata]|uniref:Cytochrome P450 n=1 Tax=Pinctada imbricata TaxID=66713 RepID=A0AA88XVK8_PINIB|nr:hypothetical protein FSP39_017737 [Pinctada imbricata]
MIDTSNLMTEFDRLHREYGDVFCFVVGSNPIIVVNGSEALRDLFIKEADSLSIRPATFILSKIANWKGIVASNGNLWKEQRAFAHKTLKSFGFGKQNFESQIHQEVDIFLRCLGNSKGQPIDFVAPLKVCIANVISSMSMGKTYGLEDNRLMVIMEMIEWLFADASFRGIAAYIPFAKHIPGDPFHVKKRENIIEDILNFLREVVEDHKKSFDEDKVHDYIDAFLKEQKKMEEDPESTFTDEQLIQSVRDFFVAGYESTVQTLRWIFLILIHNPDVQIKMRNEIESRIGNSRKPSWSQKDQLPYCEAVITECLRYKGVGPTTLPHGVEYDVYWNGYRIPQGAVVLANLRSVAYNSDTFPEPNKFDPGRFLDDEGNLKGQNLIMPFGIGRRICLGEALARMELFLFLTAVIQRFELLPEDNYDLPSLEGKLGTIYAPLPFKLRAISKK